MDDNTVQERYDRAFVQYCECVASAGGKLHDVRADASGQYVWAVEVGSAERDALDACETQFRVAALAFSRATRAPGLMPSEEEQLDHFHQWVAPVLREHGVTFQMPRSTSDPEWRRLNEAYLAIRALEDPRRHDVESS